MTVYSFGYVPAQTSHASETAENQLFHNNLSLLREYELAILKCNEYFFCPLSFAWCSWPWIGGSGTLCLGHLLLGWQSGLLTGNCPDCNGTVLVTTFGGSPLTRCNQWSGFCLQCQSKKVGRWESFSQRILAVSNLRTTYPGEISEFEGYDGFMFSWGGNGLTPARKKRLVTRQLEKPVSLVVLIDELKSGNVRKGNQPNVHMLPRKIKLNFSNKKP